MTEYPDLFAGLAAPFEPHEVKVRSQANRQFHYVTARTVMNRLDEVVGPENWWDEYEQKENSILCRLSIRLKDGRVITKADAGGHAGMQDSGDDEKSAYSDSFKRAAAKFGVGRYLYGDGSPRYALPAVVAPDPPAPPPDRAWPDGFTFAREAPVLFHQVPQDKNVLDRVQGQITAEARRRRVDLEAVVAPLCAEAIARGWLDEGGRVDPETGEILELDALLERMRREIGDLSPAIQALATIAESVRPRGWIQAMLDRLPAADSGEGRAA